MTDIFELKQDRAKLVASMREMMDKYDVEEMTAEDRAAYSKMEKDFDALNNRIEAEEKLLDRERKAGEIVDNAKKEQKSDRLEMFAKAISGNPRDVAAFMNDVDYTLGTGATAGYMTAPMQFVEQLIKGLDDAVYMRKISHKTPTLGNAQSLGFPHLKTKPSDFDWKTEVASADLEQDVDFDQREFKPYRLTKLLKLSKTLVSHAGLAPQALMNELNKVLAGTLEKAYLTGNGSGKPLGVFTQSASGISSSRDVSTGNTTTAVSFDGLINAKYAIKGQYQPKLSWIFHRDAIKMIAKLKNGEGQYIWQPSVQFGQPDRLLGNPVYMSEFAPNTFTTGNYVGIIGDFDYYWICDADQQTLQVLNELYAPTNQIGYIWEYFGDGMPVVEEAFARVTLA